MMSLMGIMIIFAAVLQHAARPEPRMLSFGHAVYYGLGALFVVHAMNAIIRAKLPIPLPVVRIFGGIAGLASRSSSDRFDSGAAAPHSR